LLGKVCVIRVGRLLQVLLVQMLVVDQLVVGARGWSASSRLLSQLYLSVGKARDVVLQLEVGEG
jgi:hypothetical protein